MPSELDKAINDFFKSLSDFHYGVAHEIRKNFESNRRKFADSLDNLTDKMRVGDIQLVCATNDTTQAAGQKPQNRYRIVTGNYKSLEGEIVLDDHTVKARVLEMWNTLGNYFGTIFNASQNLFILTAGRLAELSKDGDIAKKLALIIDFLKKDDLYLIMLLFMKIYPEILPHIELLMGGLSALEKKKALKAKDISKILGDCSGAFFQKRLYASNIPDMLQKIAQNLPEFGDPLYDIFRVIPGIIDEKMKSVDADGTNAYMLLDIPRQINDLDKFGVKGAIPGKPHSSHTSLSNTSDVMHTLVPNSPSSSQADKAARSRLIPDKPLPPPPPLKASDVAHQLLPGAPSSPYADTAARTTILEKTTPLTTTHMSPSKTSDVIHTLASSSPLPPHAGETARLIFPSKPPPPLPLKARDVVSILESGLKTPQTATSSFKLSSEVRASEKREVPNSPKVVTDSKAVGTPPSRVLAIQKKFDEKSPLLAKTDGIRTSTLVKDKSGFVARASTASLKSQAPAKQNLPLERGLSKDTKKDTKQAEKRPTSFRQGKVDKLIEAWSSSSEGLAET